MPHCLGMHSSQECLPFNSYNGIQVSAPSKGTSATDEGVFIKVVQIQDRGTPAWQHGPKLYVKKDSRNVASAPERRGSWPYEKGHTIDGSINRR